MAAAGLGEKMGYAEAQDLPSLAAGADHPAADEALAMDRRQVRLGYRAQWQGA